MKSYIRYIKDYFNLNRSEQRGLIILFCILLAIIFSIFLLPYFIKDEPVNFAEFEKKVAAFEKQQNYLSDSIQRQREKYASSKQIHRNQLKPFPFDPNNLSVKNWEKLGFSNYQIKMIKNYEAKGGKFYTATDLAKIYSISEEEFTILEPYIKIDTKPASSAKIERAPELIPLPFNPNTFSSDSFAIMGLNEKVINSITNYRKKGGVFRTKEDLKKIYGLSAEDFLKLEPFIQLPDQIELKPEAEDIAIQIQINHADTLDLQQIPGIGPSFARRIVKYRSMLGGYYKVEQLMEVYGMDSLLYNRTSPYLVFDKINLKKININTATIKELIKHPYIEFYLAKSIVTFREENGQIESLEEIRNVRLMYDELYNKIQPYLTLKEE